MEFQKFIPASVLKVNYIVLGHFYNFSLSKKIYPCRSCLDIIHRKSLNIGIEPDAIIIMMNPGSSRPIQMDYTPDTYHEYHIDHFKAPEMILAKPDNAQYQIMRLMELQNWHRVRILNLTDLQNGNSTILKQTIQKINKIKKCFPHSLIAQERRAELEDRLQSKTGIIIAAWGNINALETYAKEFINQYPNIIGLSKAPSTGYKFASPMLHKHKLEWLAEIYSLLKENE